MKISLDSTDCQNIALCSRQLISVSSRENYCCLEGSTQWHNRANLVFICCFDAGTLQLWIRRDVVIFAQRCDNIREWRNHSKITYDEKVFSRRATIVSLNTRQLSHTRERANNSRKIICCNFSISSRLVCSPPPRRRLSRIACDVSALQCEKYFNCGLGSFKSNEPSFFIHMNMILNTHRLLHHIETAR